MTLGRRLFAILLVVLVAVICVAAFRSRGPRRIDDVPLARQLLEASVPSSEHVKEPAAKLYALGFPEEAGRLLNYPEATAILPLLGRPVAASATIRDAIALPETSDQALAQLRDGFLDQQITVKMLDTSGQELPDVASAIASYGSKPMPPEHVQGALWRTTALDFGGGTRPLWLVSVSVTQHLGRPARLRMLLQDTATSLLTCQTGILAPDQPATAVCYAAGTSPAPRAAPGEAARVTSVSISDAQGYSIAQVSRNGGEVARQVRERLANTSGAAVAYVSCRQRGDCLKTFTAIVLSPSSAGFLLVATGMIWAVRWRWRGQYDEAGSNPFKPAFSIYLILVLIALPVDVLDSRALQGGAPLFTGLISTAYNSILAMPWMALRMQQISRISGAALIGGPEVDMVLSWIFMLANLAWLWCMAYPPRPARRGTRLQR